MMNRWRRRLIAGAAALAFSATPVQADVFDDILEMLSEEADDLGASAIGQVYADILRWLGPYLQYTQQLEVLFPDNPDWPTPGDVKWRVDQGYIDAKAQAEAAVENGAVVMTNAAESAQRTEALELLNVSPVSILAALQVGNAIQVEAVKSANQQNVQLSELMQDEADRKMVEAFQSKQVLEYQKYHYRSYNGSTEVFGNGYANLQVGQFATSW